MIRHQKIKDFVVFFNAKPPFITKFCRSPYPTKALLPNKAHIIYSALLKQLAAKCALA